jgi:hypothetical protein
MLDPRTMAEPAAWPRALLPALLVCSLLGVFGTVSGFLGITRWNEPIETPKLAPLPAPPEGVSADTWARVQAAYDELPEALSVVKKRRPAIDALAVVNLVASAALLVGAQLARRRAPTGLTALRTGLGLSEAYAAIALWVNVLVQRDVMEAMRPHTQALAGVKGLPAELAAAFELAQVLSSAAVVAQLAFYLWMHWYVSRAAVVAALAPER